MCMNTYEERNKLLRSLGYASYQEYLASELWSRIRDRAYAEHGYYCRLCGKIANNVHHLGYSKNVLLGKTLHQLVPLCSSCHDKVEFKQNGHKATLVQAHSQYVWLWKRAKHKPFNAHIGKCIECGNKAKKHLKHCGVCLKKVRR